VTFLWQFARRPAVTGAIAPSSRDLAHSILEGMGLESADVIFEFGAGTGAFTRAILERMKPSAQFVAVEVNPVMVKHLRRRFPGLRIMADSAENVNEFRRRHDIGPADCIVCGLPWALFPAELQRSLMAAVIESLRPGGRFATFAYLHSLWMPAARRFRRTLDDNFFDVHESEPVWRNLPPARVYRCCKSGSVRALA